MGITQIEPGRFRVEFARLDAADAGLTGRLMSAFRGRRSTAAVDLFSIGQAVCAVMAQSSERDVDGSLLAWNEYRVYLSRAEHERLRALRERLLVGLEERIRQQLTQMAAHTIGDPVVRVLVDEETDLPAGVGEILVAYVANADIGGAEQDSEMTVRVAAPRPKLRSAPAATPGSTERVVDGGDGSGVVLRWAGGSARVPGGRRVQLGRPHEGAPDGFIPLTGASNRINSAQLYVESGADGVLLARPVKANPVQVGGRLLQPGGQLLVSQLPVEVVLSNGELVVTLEPG